MGIVKRISVYLSVLILVSTSAVYAQNPSGSLSPSDPSSQSGSANPSTSDPSGSLSPSVSPSNSSDPNSPNSPANQSRLLEFSRPQGLYDRYELIRSELNAINERGENEAGAQAMLDYLLRFAEERGIDWQIFDIASRGEFHSFGQNISYSIPAAQNTQGANTSVGVIPLNTIEEEITLFFIPYIHSHTDTGSASNTAVISAVLALLENLRPVSPIEITFLGSVDNNKGIREFFSRIRLTPPRAAVFLSSASEFSSTVHIESGAEGNITPYALYQFLNQLIVSKNLSLQQSQTSQHRLNSELLTGERGGERRGERRGNQQGASVNSASFNSGTSLLSFEPNASEIRFVEGESSPEASLMALSFLIDLLFLTGEEIASPEIDTHYLNYVVFNFPIIISEQVYIILLYSAFLAILLLFIARRRAYLNAIGLGFFQMFNLLLHAATMFGALMAGQLFLVLIARIQNIDYAQFPNALVFVCVHIVIALAIFFFLAQIIRILSARFPTLVPCYRAYKLGLFLLPLVNFLVFLILNISFVHYFVWMLLGTWVYLLVKGRALRIVLMALSLSPLIFVFYQLFSNEFVLRAFFNADVLRYSMLSLILLHVSLFIVDVLPQMRLRSDSSPKARKQNALRILAPALSMLFLILAVFLAAVYAPLYSPQSPQEIRILSSNETFAPIVDREAEAGDAAGAVASTSATARETAAAEQAESPAPNSEGSSEGSSKSASENTVERELPFAITALSISALGSFNVPFADGQLTLNTEEREQSFEPLLLERNLDFSASRQLRLNQNSFSIELNSRSGQLRRYEIRLSLGQGDPIFTSSLPYTADLGASTGEGTNAGADAVAEANDSADAGTDRGAGADTSTVANDGAGTSDFRFFSGTNPPNPFVFNFAIPEESRPRLEVTAVYANEEPLRFSESEPRVFYFERRETVIFDSEPSEEP